MNAERIICVIDKPTGISPQSQVERNWKTYRSNSMVHLQNHILHANQDVSGYSLQQIPSRLSIAYRPSYNLNLPPITEPRESTNAARPLQLGPVTPDQEKLQKSNKILQVPHFSIDEGRLSIAYRPSYNLNLPPITEPGESTNAARPLQLGPVTPDQQKLQKTNKILQVPHFSIDEGLSKENNKQDNVFPPQDEIAERECNGSVCDASSPISTMQNEKQTIDGGNDGEIDLNKTPPQKTPKRRKHRPKVVVEGKPKRTPKPKATESNTTGGNSTIKRKYVRKKGINTSTDQSIDARNGVEVSNVESQAKSCKRALNFDLENEIGKKIKGREFDHQADNIKGSTFNLNVDLHSPELEGRHPSTVENVHQNIRGKGKQTENLYNFIHSVDKITPEELAIPPTTSKDHTLNVLARVLNMRNANTNQSGGHGMNGQVQHHIGGTLAQILANTHKQNLDGYRQPKLLNRPQLLEDFVDVSERQESKREYSCTEIRRPPVASQIWSHAVSGTGHNNRDSIEFWQNCLEASRSKNVEQFFGRKSSMPPSKTTFKDCSEQIQSTRNRNFCPESSKLHQNGGLPYNSGEGKSTFIDLTDETSMVIHQWCKNSTDSGHKYQKQVHPYAEQMAHRAHHFAKSQTTNSLIAVDNFHMVFASQRDSQVTKGNQTTNVPTLLSTKRRAARPMPSNIISKNLQGSRHESKKVAGAHEYNRNIFSIDDITKRMKDLHFDSFGEQNAVVPYRGDGAIVPFEVFDPIKKRRPRPKVDLDPETNRLWNLLMGKEGSENAEPVDNGKQKYWEEERKVFRGRVDSFIARMHLVQGDRRFSKWKGSVVDSVIGVFLTQNVSDHLSSSAFMSLAAKFPATRESCFQNSRNPSNEHEVIISYPDERTSCHHPLIREPVIHHSSVTFSQQSQYKAENVTSGKSFSIHNHTRRKEEECMILSQCSSESPSFQASEDIRSSSGSNSEVEDHITGSSFRKNLGTLNLYQHAERIDAFQQYEVQEMGSSFADNRPSNNVQPPENLVQNQNPGVVSGRNAYSGIHRKMLMGIEERESDLLKFIGKERPHAFQQCEVQEMGSSFADNRPSNNENLVQNQNPGVASGRNAYSRPLTSSVLHYQRPAPPSNDSWQKMLMGIEERESDLEFIEKERSHAFQQFEVQEMGSSFADNRPSNNVQQPENLVQNQNPGVASSRNAYSRPLTSSVLHYQRPAPPSNNFWQKMLMGIEERESDLLEFIEKESSSSLTSEYVDTANGTTMKHVQDKARQSAESSHTDQQSRSSYFFNHEVINKQPGQQMNLLTESQSRNSEHFINFCPRGMQETSQPESSTTTDPIKSAEVFRQTQSDNQNPSGNITLEPIKTKTLHVSDVQSSKVSTTSNARKRKAEKEQVEAFDWDTLRKHVQSEAGTKGRSSNTVDSLNYEALRNADVHEISDAIKERGMNNMLAARMKDFLNRLVKDHGSMDLEWLRDVQPDKAKDYLLSIRGLGLKSVECVRLLTLHHLAFPVDTNVGRIAVRLGWVPLQPLPETLQLHLLELYPVLESIQKYLWPRLCMLDQETLYELHYQLITFGKVFCTKRQPNCNACPMRGECRHFASAFASARLALPGPEERSIVCSDVPSGSSTRCVVPKPMPLPPPEDNVGRGPEITRNCEPIIEEPATPESSIEVSERDIEDAFYEDPDEIPEIKLNIEEFTSNLQSFIQEKMEIQEGDMSKALVALSPQFASIPMPKLKQVTRLRTEHQVYELLDSHPLLEGLDRREPDDPSPYLLAIWAPGETADSVDSPESRCTSSKGGHCNTKTCFSCNSTREAEAQTVRGTILIPCRTAMRGSFPLNGTYFQVNEVFADDETSMNPIDVPRSLIWNLPRRTVFFGTSVSTIFKGMSTEDVQYCFWKGFVCVRGFDQKTRAPRPLKARLHLAASKIVKKNE